jgi:5-hydroxyisourate hydrolase
MNLAEPAGARLIIMESFLLLPCSVATLRMPAIAALSPGDDAAIARYAKIPRLGGMAGFTTPEERADITMALIAAEVLDGTYGQMAGAVPARLDRAEASTWVTVASACTGGDGRVDDWSCPPFSQGLYRLTLGSARYFAGLGVSTAFPEIQVTFRALDDNSRCHVKVVLSPYSYSAHISVTPGTYSRGRA